MVKVTRGALPRERKKGYEQYRTQYEVSEGVDIRRQLPVTGRETSGASNQQFREKERFAYATKIYSNLTPLQRDFYKRTSKLVVTTDKKGREVRRLLTGRTLAIHEISQEFKGEVATYEKPIECCMCVQNAKKAAIQGLNLEITTGKDRNFKLNKVSDEYGCFTPYALSKEKEPYNFNFTPIPPRDITVKCKAGAKVEYEKEVKWQKVLPHIYVLDTGRTLYADTEKWVLYQIKNGDPEYWFEDWIDAPPKDYDYNDVIARVRLFTNSGIVWYSGTNGTYTNDLYLNNTFVETLTSLKYPIDKWKQVNFLVDEEGNVTI